MALRVLTSFIPTSLAILALIFGSSALSCTQQYQCVSGGVTTNFNYAQCVEGQCVCTATFQGNATTAYPCQCTGTYYSVSWGNDVPYCIQCTPPRYIIYDQNDNNPYCASPRECQIKLIDNYNAQQNAIISVFGKALFNPLATTLINNPDLIVGFSDTVVSRVTPVSPPGFGFPNKNITLEYIYAFASVAGVSRVNIRGLFTDPNKNVTCFTLDLGEYNPQKHIPFNISFSACARFDENNLITAYDAIIPNIGTILDVTNTTEQEAVILGICEVHEAFCTGDLQQYASFDDCLYTLTYEVPFGTYFTAGSTKSIDCYSLHTTLIVAVPVAGPAQHCQHIGPNSTYCQNWAYESYYGFDPVGNPDEYIIFTSDE